MLSVLSSSELASFLQKLISKIAECNTTCLDLSVYVCRRASYNVYCIPTYYSLLAGLTDVSNKH